jgi:hypothetical protein
LLQVLGVVLPPEVALGRGDRQQPQQSRVAVREVAFLERRPVPSAFTADQQPAVT